MPIKKQTATKKKVAPRKKTASTAVRRRGEKLIGKIEHYYDNIKVAALKLKDSLKIGDVIHVEGGTLSFDQKIASMQIDHKNVKKAKKGNEVGFKISKKVREGYRVFKK